MNAQPCLRIALAQINTTVGDLPRNRALVEETYHTAVAAGATLIIFPELTLTGYPPEDLLLKPSFLEDTRATLTELLPTLRRGLVILGFADEFEDRTRNAAAVIAGGELLDVYHKCTLPNYGVFDEKRYFSAGRRCPLYRLGPWQIAINICEDMWVPAGVPRCQSRRGANLMVNISASPYHAGKGRVREALVRRLAAGFNLPVVHANLVGGQDELVFDGLSLAADARGEIIARAPQFVPHLLMIDLPLPSTVARQGPNDMPAELPPAVQGVDVAPLAEQLQSDLIDIPEAAVFGPGPKDDGAAGAACAPPAPRGFAANAAPENSHMTPDLARQIAPISLNAIALELPLEEEIYRALMLGLRDYVTKNGFRGVVLGLSGGIDSALTATIAADALGREAVVVISMPSPYTSASAREGARALADNLGIEFHEVPIDDLFADVLSGLRPLLGDQPPDVTEENIQARIRGLILMAYSNRFGHLVLATGNKSEVAVGYCTLYGDMVGGFSVLKDVLKTQVYRLATWRNAKSHGTPPIPEDTIERPPSAELRKDQQDTDSLPPYEVLDPIVAAFVEQDRRPRDLVANGLEREIADRVFAMIQGNEYKRRQAAPGIKITPRAFGRDRRYPLTNRYRPRAGRGS